MATINVAMFTSNTRLHVSELILQRQIIFDLPFKITPAIYILNTVINNIYVSPGNCIEQNYQY